MYSIPMESTNASPFAAGQVRDGVAYDPVAAAELVEEVEEGRLASTTATIPDAPLTVLSSKLVLK